jgi:hypothetical protein
VKFCFGDIVVVRGNLIGVVVKAWIRYAASGGTSHEYEVYVRMSRQIEQFREDEMERYMVRHKERDEQEMEWQRNAMEGM